MHVAPSEKAFLSFIERRGKDFSRISGATKGEWRADDVRNEAWLLAAEIGSKRGQPLDLDDPADESLLLAYLFNRCIRYTERVVRKATRLDHATGDDTDGQHPLMNLLAADGGAHPAQLLEAWEEAEPEPTSPDAYDSPAAAWLHLLNRFQLSKRKLFEFLLISHSWGNTCIRRAVHLAKTQNSFHLTVGVVTDNCLHPWRSFKLPPLASPLDLQQLDLDFSGIPPQPARGQLWLI